MTSAFSIPAQRLCLVPIEDHSMYKWTPLGHLKPYQHWPSEPMTAWNPPAGSIQPFLMQKRRSWPLNRLTTVWMDKNVLNDPGSCGLLWFSRHQHWMATGSPLGKTVASRPCSLVCSKKLMVSFQRREKKWRLGPESMQTWRARMVGEWWKMLDMYHPLSRCQPDL